MSLTPKQLQAVQAGQCLLVGEHRYERTTDDRIARSTPPGLLAHAELASLVGDIVDLLTVGPDGRIDLDDGGVGGADAVDGILDILNNHGLLPQQYTGDEE